MKEHTCDICGREIFRKIKSHGYTLCSKHYKQLKKYGKFLDKNPRTIYDKNEIHIDGDIAYIDLYDKDCNFIAQTLIDAEDVPHVKYTKWRLNGNGYVINWSRKGNNTTFLHRRILNCENFVDHINHDPLDNRKCNLRIVSKSQNQMNTNYKGVSRTKNGKYYAYIKINQKLINLGCYIDAEEAFFARWYAETLLFKEYKFPKEKPQILEVRERQIREYVNKKVQRL